MVQWSEIGTIAISWVLSPVLGGVVAWLLFRSIKSSILVYNERADTRLRDITVARAELTTRPTPSRCGCRCWRPAARSSSPR